MMDPRLTPARPDLAAEHLRDKVQAERYAVAVEKTVSEPWLDMFDRPGGRVVNQLLYGDMVDVYETAAWFAWVQNRRDRYVGYVVAKRLHEPGPAPNKRVSANWAHIYPRPNMKLPTDRQPLPFMATLHADEEFGGFFHVQGGFCPVPSLIGLLEPIQDFVAVAERFTGVPYLWGGCTPMGFDCSGLVQISLMAAGIDVLRDADQQAASIGIELDADAKLVRGDLVFWDGHVGLMRDADTIVHANAHHMAVASEPLRLVAERAAVTGRTITARRRIVA